MNIKDQIAVMQHFADGGEVEERYFLQEWRDSICPVWNWTGYEYRIKPKAKRTIKLEAWLDNTGELRHFTEQVTLGEECGWTRLPLLDFETEVA